MARTSFRNECACLRTGKRANETSAVTPKIKRQVGSAWDTMWRSGRSGRFASGAEDSWIQSVHWAEYVFDGPREIRAGVKEKPSEPNFRTDGVKDACFRFRRKKGGHCSRQLLVGTLNFQSLPPYGPLLVHAFILGTHMYVGIVVESIAHISFG